MINLHKWVQETIASRDSKSLLKRTNKTQSWKEYIHDEQRENFIKINSRVWPSITHEDIRNYVHQLKSL